MQGSGRITGEGAAEITAFIYDEVQVQEDQIKEEVQAAVEDLLDQRKIRL